MSTKHTKKQRYSSKKKANNAVRAIKLKYNRDMRAYYCNKCHDGTWHLTGHKISRAVNIILRIEAD